MRKYLLSACLLALPFTASSALLERLGGLAYYDTDADLTWLANATSAGPMNWEDANSWAEGLNIAGVTGWRLPHTIDVGNDGATYTNLYQGVDWGYNITTHSELSNLYYNVLGNSSFYTTSGGQTGCAAPPDLCLTNSGPFSNVVPFIYWSATEYALSSDDAWFFGMNYGFQREISKSYSSGYAWAVHDGDVSAVPIPAAVWLFSSGLIGLTGIARRKNA